MPIEEADILPQVNGAIAAQLAEIGEHLTLEVAKAAPKDSWELVKSIEYSVDPSDLSVTIHVGVHYAFYIEFGFRHRVGKKSVLGKGKKKRLGYSKLSPDQIAGGEYKSIAPNPFIRRTVYSQIPWIIEKLNSILGQAA